MDKMAGIMDGAERAADRDRRFAVVKVNDYEKPEETGLPSANVLIYRLANGETVVRPSEQSRKSKYTTQHLVRIRQRQKRRRNSQRL